MTKKSFIKVTDFSKVVTEQTGKNIKVYSTYEDGECFFVGNRREFTDKIQADQFVKRLVTDILNATN